jgi:hypothetical protein
MAPRVESTPVLVRVVGRRLPGSRCGSYTDVIVGLPQKIGAHPTDLVSGDAREATWETKIEVRDKDGQPAFYGPAVHGKQPERFLYLCWIGRLDGASLAMFRRAKLRLDSVPAAVLAKSLRNGVLVGRLELTDAKGMPLCASVHPPTIEWKSA